MARNFESVQEGEGSGFGAQESRRTAGQDNPRNKREDNGIFSKFANASRNIQDTLQNQYNGAVIKFGIFSYSLDDMLNNDWADAELEF